VFYYLKFLLLFSCQPSFCFNTLTYNPGMGKKYGLCFDLHLMRYKNIFEVLHLSKYLLFRQRIKPSFVTKESLTLNDLEMKFLLSTLNSIFTGNFTVFIFLLGIYDFDFAKTVEGQKTMVISLSKDSITFKKCLHQKKIVTEASNFLKTL
jgi:hypothetical protein